MLRKLYNKDVFKYFIISKILLIILVVFGCAISKNNIFDVLNFYDNEWYLNIALNGYTLESTVFFPIIPLLIKFFNLFGISILGMVLLNTVLVYFSGLLIYKLSNIRGALLWLFSPISIFCSMLYTESVFVFLSLLTIYLYNDKKYLLSGIMLGLCAATRNLGSMLFITIFIYMIYDFFEKKIKFIPILKMYIPSTIISLLYPLYLQLKFGNWKMFVDAQFIYWNREHGNIFLIIFKDIKYLLFDGDFISKLSIIITVILFVIMIFLIVIDVKCNKKITINVLYLVLTILVIYSSYRHYIVSPSTSFYRYFLGCSSIYLIGSSLQISSKIYKIIYFIFISFFTIVSISFCFEYFLC